MMKKGFFKKMVSAFKSEKDKDNLSKTDLLNRFVDTYNTNNKMVMVGITSYDSGHSTFSKRTFDVSKKDKFIVKGVAAVSLYEGNKAPQYVLIAPDSFYTVIKNFQNIGHICKIMVFPDMDGLGGFTLEEFSELEVEDWE